MRRRRRERSVNLVTDNVELQDENKPTNKNRDRSKEIKLTPSGNQITERYQNDQEVSCDKILTCSSSNNYFDSASEYINTSITGRSMVSGVHIVDNDIDYEDKVSRSMPQKSSFRSCKKQKVVRNMDDQVSMSFKSFAEQYSIYAASIAGKEDLENLRQLVRNKTSVGKGEITVNSCSNILHKQKSIDVLEQQNDTEKYVPVSPLQNNFSYINSNILKTPSSLVADSITSVPLSGIKKLASTPGNFLVLTQKETTDSVTKSGHKRNDFEFNKPSLVFRGVVAFVDVRSELFDNSQGVKEVMSSLGATVEKTFNKQVTHVIFKDGTLATYSKAKKLNIPLISVLWVEACKKERTLLPFETFVPFGLEKYDHLVTHTRKKYLKMAFTDYKKLRNTKSSKMWNDELVINIYSETDKDSATVMCCKCAAEQYPVEDTKKHCTCVEKQSMAEDRERCNITSKKRQKLRDKFRSALKTIVPSGSSNKGDGKLEEDLHSNKSSDESSCKVDDDSCLESLETLLKVNRKSAPPRLITIRKSRRKKLYCKERIQGCRKNLDTLPTDSDVSSSARNDILKTDKHEYTISVDGKNNHSKSKECYDDKYRPVCISDTVKNKNFVPECDRNIIMYSKDDEVESDKKTGQDCVNNKITVGSLKEVTVKKRKRKLLPLESNICINSQLDCTADMSLCSPYYESTPYKDTSGIDEPVLVSESRCIISEDITPSDKVEQELHSFLRKESCALFIENKSRKRDFCQRLMATIVCTSMSHKDVEEVESVVRKLGRFRVENKVSHRTTHVVTCKPRRTMNLLKGIARGCWILFQDWVTKSGVAEKWLNEERFELTGFSSAVKQCRLERQAFGPLFSLELFAHVGMIYVCHGTSPSKCDLIELLQLCGGNIVNNIDIANIVIGKGIQQSESRPLLVSEKWILDSVTRNTQLDPHRYKNVTSD